MSGFVNYRLKPGIAEEPPIADVYHKSKRNITNETTMLFLPGNFESYFYYNCKPRCRVKEKSSFVYEFFFFLNLSSQFL